MTQNPYTSPDLQKLMESFSMPNMSFQVLMALQQKNVEALQLANKTMMEGMQLLMKREIELIQAGMDDAMKSMQDLMSASDPQENVKMRFEKAKEVMERSTANLNELAEMTQQSNREAFEILNSRYLDSLEEMKAAMNKKG